MLGFKCANQKIFLILKNVILIEFVVIIIFVTKSFLWKE
jgi:hypothetical protein